MLIFLLTPYNNYEDIHKLSNVLQNYMNNMKSNSNIIPVLPKYRVYSKILNFLKHVHCHDDSTNLSKQVLDQQIINDWPGFSKSAIQICEELNICGLLDSTVSKNEFKNRIRKACDEANQKEIYQQIQTYKKMSALRDEIRKGNSYFFTETLQNVRTLFRLRADLYESKMNFKNKYKH